MELGAGLRWVVEACRSNVPGPAAALAGGAGVLPEHLVDFVPHDVLTDLTDRGLLVTTTADDGSECAHLSIACQNFNNLVSVMPAEQRLGADYVHLNADTFWLRELIWEHAEPGEFAIELAAGNAIVAAFLVARYRKVLAADLPGPWMSYAQLTLAANAGRGRPSAVMACDVASALRPRSFDLVATNSPWSPAVPRDAEGNELTFMAGGSTGTELPSRFLLEGAELLRPGGTAITLCLDPEFENGSRPLAPTLDQLRKDGLSVECIASRVFPDDLVTKSLRKNRLPTLKRARHIAVIVKRPHGHA